MPSSIPRGGGRKYCKVCFKNTSKQFWMEDLGDRIKCPNCRREVSISAGKPLTRPLRSVDPVRFRTAGFVRGGVQRGGRDKLDTWETPAPIRKPGRRIPRQLIGRFPRKSEQDIFHDSTNYQIIIYDLPFKTFEDVRCEIVNGILIVESLIEGFDFLQKFSLPEDVLPSSLQTSLKNSILDIHLRKKERSESENFKK